MIPQHFKRIAIGATLYCDNKPVTLIEKYSIALSLCETEQGRMYITCWDLEKKPGIQTNDALKKRGGRNNFDIHVGKARYRKGKYE